MSDLSIRLGLPYLQPSQAQKHVTHNEALQVLDILVQLVVEDFYANQPPGTPVEGQIWALGASPIGDWAGKGLHLACWLQGAWVFIAPQTGWRATLGTEMRIWDGSQWALPVGETSNLAGLGINTAYDLVNRLSVSAQATLLSHEGAGHQLKINKASATDTASLLFQTNWSGRAEMGTAGNDNLAVKVSADGATWKTGAIFAAATGVASFPNGAEATGLTLTGVLKGSGAAALGGFRCSYGGTANAIALSYGLSTLSAGLRVRFTATAYNTGATTINLDGLGAIAAVTVTGVALPAGYIRTGVETEASYNGTNWVVRRLPEKITSANGTARRYEDGSQHCSSTVSIPDVSTAQGGGYKSSAAVLWVFPAAFISLPNVLADVPSRDDVWAPTYCSGGVQAYTRGSSFISKPGPLDVTIQASGSWY